MCVFVILHLPIKWITFLMHACVQNWSFFAFDKALFSSDKPLFFVIALQSVPVLRLSLYLIISLHKKYRSIISTLHVSLNTQILIEINKKYSRKKHKQRFSKMKQSLIVVLRRSDKSNNVHGNKITKNETLLKSLSTLGKMENNFKAIIKKIFYTTLKYYRYILNSQTLPKTRLFDDRKVRHKIRHHFSIFLRTRIYVYKKTTYSHVIAPVISTDNWWSLKKFEF